MNIDVIFRIAAIGILTAVCSQLLKKSDKEEMATLTTLAGVIVVLTMVISMISTLFETLRFMFTLY